MAEVALHPLAQREFEASVAWYQERSHRAAERFAAAVRRVLDELGESPERHGWNDDEFRQALVQRFPYSVLYKVLGGGDVLVVAVAHAGREPDYWRGRT